MNDRSGLRRIADLRRNAERPLQTSNSRSNARKTAVERDASSSAERPKRFRRLFSRAQQLLSGLQINRQALLGWSLGAVLVTSLAFYAYGYVTSSPRFAIREIRVSGLGRLDRARLLERGGASIGNNIFLRSTAELKTAFLTEPWVRDVQVRRELPDTLHVMVSEFVPVAVVLLDREVALHGETSTLFLVDASGAIFDTWQHASRQDRMASFSLPLVTGIRLDRAEVDPVYRREAIANALWVLQHAPAGLGAIDEVHVAEGERIAVQLAAPSLAMIELGDARNHTELGVAMQRAARIFARFSRAQVESIRFASGKSHAVVRLRNGS